MLFGILTILLMSTQEIWGQTYSIDRYAQNYAGGSGTKNDPYLISNDMELAKLARDVNNGNTSQAFLGKYFMLTQDIDLSGGIWMPIGKYYNDGNGNRLFFGKFDGNGHVIKNMHIQWEDVDAGKAKSVWGLFSTLQGESSTNLTTVTNLIIENATVEKKRDFSPNGSGYYVGVVAGEIYPNTELSNIIISGSEITDNDETYDLNRETKIGGIAGNVQNEGTYRIFNIAADTKINMLKKTSVFNGEVYIAQGFGRFSYDMKGEGSTIEPTNIYIYGKEFNIDNSRADIKKGGITAECKTEGTTTNYHSTWYYALNVAGGKNLGSQKDFTTFANDFVDKANKLITTKGLEEDKLNWSYTSGTGFNFGSTKLTVKRGYNTIITAETIEGNAGNEKYLWYTSSDKKNWTLQNENNAYNNFSISLKDYDQYVYAILEDGSSQSGVAKIDARRVDAVMKTHGDSKTLYIDITNNIWENNDSLNITYSWVKNDDVVGTEPTFDKSSLASTDKLSCYVIVTTKDGFELLNTRLVYTKSVVYLCPAGATATMANGNTISYNQGDDTHDGLTPQTAVKTWKGAYSKLEKQGSWDDNIIVLMGKSDQSVTNNGNNGFTSVTFNTSSDWEREKAKSPFFRNTTITGSWDGVNYNGIIEMYGGHDRNHSLPIYGDTRFQYLTFNRNNNNENFDILYCQFYNLEMGEGIQMKNYKNMFSGDGTIKGAVSTSFQIFGGFMDDNRFSPLSTEGNLKKMDDALPHGREGFKIKIKSGHYSSICVGGRQTVENRNGVMGSPNMPIKCTIDVDIDRKFNNNHNDNNSDLDVAIVLAGNHEGAMVGDVDIIIKSGKIGRVVNGSLGARRETRNNNVLYNAPYNTYMGRANILIDPAQSESNNKNTDVNSRVEITEIYGGSTGRGFQDREWVENPFYGYSTITIKGGTFLIPKKCTPEEIFSGIYGAGAGGMNGIGDDTNHTTDERIPYWRNSSTKSVMAFGNYDAAKANLCMYKCYNADTHTYTEVDPRLTNNKIIIEGGIFGSKTRKIDGIYGGGSGYMSSDLWTTNGIPSKDGGNIYGKAGETVASITIKGGEFYCENGIFAGGRGTDYYYAHKAYNGKPDDYQDLGKIYGNVELTINGGKFHCPIFGGGYGVADAKLLNSNNINTLENMARLYGSSTVKINGGTFFKNIYGGGDMAVVEKGTNVIISDSADIRADVFAGGNGRIKRSNSDYDIKDNTWKPELVGKVLGGTNLNFYGTSAQAPSIYGDIYGGGNRAQVEGDTHINIYAANFAGEIYGGGKGLITDSIGKLLDADLYTYADVKGNTFVKLAQDQGAQTEGESGKKQDNFSINVIWDKKWNGTDWTKWNDNKSEFFNDGQFVCPHNIYGGGNQACNVTGKATLTILKGMTPFGLLKTAEWKKAYDDSDHPHFAVFGGGYGINTTVDSTDVTVNVNGDYGIYNTEIEDISVFDNSKGIPNFTILSALGGGYAGKVNKSTKVTIDGKTFLHRVYGGGFGDPSSTENNETGQIGGNTEVYIQGANIYGDVFGGGAGVAPKDINGTYTYFTDVAKVLGTTKVEISGDAKIYGNVYGGGDIANIKSYITRTGAAKEAYYNTKPKSESKLDQTTGKFLSYEAKDYTTFVNITGGDIFGEVFGGGKGLKKVEAPEYYKVGRINGNTLVHVVNTNATSLADTDSQGNIVPFIWSNIYGGCAFGTVNGSTLVHIEGGKLGHNIYGGGYGNIKIDLTGNETEEEKEEITRNTVLGKVDKNKEGTYANILGNTKVQIDGGTWIWNRKADINGNITTWLAVQNNVKICENIDEFKEITAAILKAKTVNEITNEKAKDAINRIINDKNTQQFYAFTKGTMNSGSFKRDHNIYGGGNRACYVGFGQDGNSTIGNGTSDSNGLSEVIINHSPLADVITKDGNQISVFDETSLAGLCWYISSKNTSDPEFSIFGAGFGANTKVVKTEVCVQPGNKMNDDGVITVNGIKYRYLNQNADLKTYVDFEKQIYNDFLKVSKDDKKLYFGSVTGSNPGDADFDPMTFKRYHASRWAWTLGLPGFTFQAIHGGGFSGYVTGETYVETDCQPFCENIFGAGVGAMPIGNITTANQGESYDFGKVGSLSRVFIKSGYVAQNVYGGGAGIESIYDKNQNTWIDFPNMARVPKTEVYVYGRNIKYRYNLGLIARTMILGSVYGGGDVANVGNNEDEVKEPDVFNFEYHQVPERYTSLVNIRGGVVFSQVFAGGRGRLKSECKDYKKLGGIYGNTSLVIDRPNITYPYFDEEKKEYIKPWSDNAMKHPDNDKNKDIMPAFLERIYGGCENGTVYGNTFMSISDGQIGHGIYGGGWGNCDTLTVNGTDTLTVTSADVTGNTNIMINGGQALLSSYWNPETRSWRPASIIDGIIYSPQYNHQALKFKINHNIYAGGNEACEVGNNTNILIVKGLLNDNTEVKPGQDKKKMKFYQTNEWKEIYNKVGSPHFSIFGGGFGEKTYVKGNTNITIDMQGRDANNHQDIELKPGKEHEHFYSDFSYMDIVGGGYSGTVEGSTNISGAGGVFCRRVFGGGFYSSVKETNVTIKAIDCRDIFGGGFMGDVKEATHVIIGSDNSTTGSTTGGPSGTSKFNNSDIHIHGNVYGGNDVSGYVNITAEENGFRDNGGEGSNIKILGGHIYQNVYGAGNGNYLYALDKNQNQKVTVNEYYPMNPEDPNSETVPLVYTVPMRKFIPSYKEASDAAKIVNINSWRPLTNKVNIEIKGNSTSEKVNIAGDVYGGGNSATVLKVKDKDNKAVEKVGNIQINIGSHVNIGRVFMGCNGDELFAKSEDNDFMNKFQKLNGNVEDYTQELNLADTIDWFNPSNKDIGTLYLPTKLEDRPTVYPHLIDLYFQPVETDIQGELRWNGTQTGEGLEDCTIKTFYCGGNRGNMNIYPNPNARGNVINYIFPEGLTITDKIVGGCNNANYNYKGLVNHEGGYLLGIAHSEKPFIKLTIKNKFEPTIVNNEAYQGGCVYGGCYKTGTVRGDVTIDLRSDMLAGKDKKKLENSNDSLATKPEYASLNVYGAGYGMESYVYGNTRIVMGDSISCKEAAIDNDKFSASGVSANFIYGGGQQGNVIGLTDVDILNGHVFRSVTGGSYSGYVYGSTQIKVGYPSYYKVNKNGKYILNRTDKKNIGLKNDDGIEKTPTIKQEIYLLAGELISKGVYDDIVEIDNGKRVEITENNKENYFTPVAAKEPSVGWDNVNINIDEAIYGGGYSLAQGTSVLANNTTVLKLTKDFNVDKAFTNSAEHLEELKALPDGTTAGFGGNTLILIGDRKTSEHITISQQDMKEINLPVGTDLYGYYYKCWDGDKYTYRFIYEQEKYFKQGEGSNNVGLVGIKENKFYEHDSEGGIFGDGHLSYAQGFRSADITGYGFAGHTIDNPKIINTLQRMDLLRLEDNCFSLLGARDYTVNEINKTPYSIARVGEIKMVATDENIKLIDNKLQAETTVKNFKYDKKTRNFMGLANNIHYVGAVKSNVQFSDKWHNENGEESSDTYQTKKQKYIDNYKSDKQKYETEFKERNNGTAKNMIGIASDYALKIQNAQEITDPVTNKMKEKIYYGPIYGVIEMNLMNARTGEGGGYVYADNIHENKDFLETTGNFVFPLSQRNKDNNRYIVDDCSPIGFNDMKGQDPDTTAEIHYWYVTGLNYYYNAHITGYTYKEPISFYNDNSDGLTALAGLKAEQKVTIKSWKMRSGHLDNYSCDLEKDQSNKYTLYVGASDEHRYNPSKGFAAKLPMSGTTAEGTYDKKNYISQKLQTGNAKIAFMLADSIDNTQADYYKDHLSKKCQATLVLEADALDDKNQVRTDTNGKPIKYTYTIYLTIEYVQGPTFTGHITIDNCALPGEMIRLKKDQVKIAADQAFAANGYFWHIGKLKRDKDGMLKKDEKGDMQFDEETSWLLKTNSSENTYKQGDKIDDSRKDLFAGSVYDKTRDYLDIPAYYFMNGYGVQLGVTMNGFDNVVFPVNMAANDTLVVHNYHQMEPHKTGVNLHLPEAIQRAKNESYFADPRIYINDVSDLTAFINFVDTTKIQENAQFILQSDLTIPKGYDGSKVIFKGILHGNGHIIEGLGEKQSLFSENQGKIYNLGLTTGSIAAKGNTKGTSSTGEYHCCFEYAPASSPDTPIVYGMDGKANSSYTHDDFKYGKVAYDLNGYYLRARKSNSTDADKAALKYVYDYYANGDYQYAYRTDEITGNNTGITYLRKGQDSDQPNYGQTETRHDKTHTIDQARAQGYQAATDTEKEKRTGNYIPQFNHHENKGELMNDFLFWGQNLQSTPADYPAKIASQQNKYMTNRVYRTDAYYGNTKKDYFHYNAYNQDTKRMGTYVHIPTTTAINFAATDRDEPDIYDNLTIKDGVTQNLLVYTADDTSKDNEAYDIVHQALNYDENTAEGSIQGHHIVKTGETTYATPFLHLVERTAKNENSEGETCNNNDFCAPIQFTVTNHAWYVRKPMYYAEDSIGAWEGICLPFTVQKAVASLNGEITHFYGTPTADELSNPATNTHTLHHEYWLRGLTSIEQAGTEPAAIFQRPGLTSDGLFMPIAEGSSSTSLSEGVSYTFATPFFIDTYESHLYNKDANPYYAKKYTYSNYPLLTSEVPYIVRFPGEGYYEFDLSSKFYNDILGKSEPEQTVAFNAYGYENMETSYGSITIPVTKQMATTKEGYSHCGTFTAKAIKKDAIYSMNDKGNAFISEASTATSVMPFRTYMTAETTKAKAMSYAPYMIKIAESTGIDKITPEIGVADKDDATGSYLIVRPINNNKVRIESNISTTIYVYTITGQLYRILDVIPGNSVYSGFQQGAYIFGKTKIMVQ